MTTHRATVPLDDDFLRDDLDPAEKERRRLAVEDAIVEAEKVKPGFGARPLKRGRPRLPDLLMARGPQRRITIPLDDDFLRNNLDPAERERRRRAVEAAAVEADEVEARLVREGLGDAESAATSSPTPPLRGTGDPAP